MKMDQIQLIWFVSLLAGAVLTWLGLQPILSFATRGWRIKRDDVLSSLSREAKRLYFLTFLKQTPQDPDREFEKLYARRYGRYRLIAPSLLFAAILFPSAALMPMTGLADTLKPTGAGALVVLPTVAASGIGGAYVWTMFSLIEGAAKYDLPPGAILIAALRIAAAVPMGYAFASIGGAGDGGFAGPFLAFAIAAFPLRSVQMILRRLANKKLDLDIGTDDQDGQVTKLDGVDPPVADRLQQADISTIAQLAYSDPVQLSMRTNLAFDFVVDCVDQALLWLYFGPNNAQTQAMDKLRVAGLRGAMGVRNLVHDLEDPTNTAALQVLSDLAASLGLGATSLRRALEEVSDAPYTCFIHEVWAEALDEAPRPALSNAA